VSSARAGAVVLLALVALDVAGVPALLPSARLELGTSTSGLMWVQEAYLLALAVPLLALGPLARAVDTRLLATAGLGAFAAGALLAAGAGGNETLVAGRVLQGAGTAALALPALASLGPPAESRRGLLALAALAAGALFALIVAPLLGGALAEKADWRWLFRLELVPAAIAALLLTLSPPPEPTLRRHGSLALGLPIAAAGLIQAAPWGWASADTLLLLVAGGVLVALAWQEAAPSAAAVTVTGCLATMLLFVPEYFELVRGLSPLRSGLLTVAITGPAATLAPMAALVARRAGAHLLLGAGLLCGAVGALGVTRIEAHSSYALVVLSLAVLGAGGGTAAGALTAHRHPAPADTLVSTAAGAALVVAAAGAVFEHAQAAEREGGASFEDALAAGLARSAWLVAALLAVAAVVSWRRAR
jgi:MFS family permease